MLHVTLARRLASQAADLRFDLTFDKYSEYLYF